MKTRAIIFLISTVLMTACNYLPTSAKNADVGASSNSTAKGNVAPAAEKEATPALPNKTDKKNLLAIGNGAFVIEKSSEAALNWRAINIIDELANVGWASEKGKTSNQTLLIELPGKTTLKTIVFDTASVDTNLSAAKDITVEISDTSAISGFQEILATSLKDKQDGQEFVIKQPVAGRWLRLNVKNNYGSAEYLEIMDLRGYGDQEILTPLNNVSGTYESRFGNFHIKQEGNSVTGCYDANEGVIQGGIDSRAMTLTWKERGTDNKGPAVMVFSQDGKQFYGAFGRDTIAGGFFGEWNGKKISDQVGSCAHLKTLEGGKAAQSQIGQNLKDNGRAIIYGINFDFNSDVIKAESKPTLDQIAAVLQENKDWKMTVEGHTDNIGGDAFNKTLSDKRASAVKAYLVGKGVEPVRLNSSGMGMSKPVAANDTEAGRAQNRRVELVKN